MFPKHREEADAAVSEIHTAANQPLMPREVWSAEELVATILAQLEPVRSKLTKFCCAAPSLFSAL